MWPLHPHTIPELGNRSVDELIIVCLNDDHLLDGY
jgi:hypothetical protein